MPRQSFTIQPRSRLKKRYIFALVSRGGVASSIDSSRGEATFPQIDTTNLSPTRQKIISLAKTEFKAQSTGTKFSQGAEEAWCANFVSWIMYQAGAPLKIRILAAGVSRGRLPCVNTTRRMVGSSLLIPATITCPSYRATTSRHSPYSNKTKSAW